ncbi:hypothetical protein [Paracoccus sp. KR1-242]|uniref:hypothetical protein n=1 Tax=Paracoccus sp. KR1-242 TaxID=3410028 RepID=UPI003C091063
MADRKLSETIRGASAVNLKYSAELLNLGREYVRAFTSALTEGNGAPEPETQRPPLLLAGRTGETANAAFAIGNRGAMKGTVTVSVSGDFADTKVSVEPERLALDNAAEEIIVRILARIGPKTESGKDYIGTVLIPEMDHRLTDFVLRKLPD